MLPEAGLTVAVVRRNGDDERGVEGVGEDLSPVVKGEEIEISSIEAEENPPGALDKIEGLKVLKLGAFVGV